MAVMKGSTLSEEQRRFLDENPFVGVLTTLRPDGSPHSTVVWVDVLDDGTPCFNTARRRAKERHLSRDPRLTLIVVDPETTFRWLSISGHAKLTEEGADAQMDKLAKKYLDEDVYPWRNPEEIRVQVRIQPELIETSGFED